MDLIPPPVVYAGLGGCVIALVVATATNNWSPRVFFLLALRLAIGWHFLFEGLHKVHSYTVGPTDTNRVFSSEPYFKQSPTWFGAQVRKRLDDPQAVIAAKLAPTRQITPQEFAALSVEEQAAACPPPVAAEFDALAGRAEEVFREAAEKQKDAPKRDPKEAATEAVRGAKAAYARWVYGVDGRDTRVKFVTGDPALTAPQRLRHLDWMREQVKEAEERREAHLGTGNGTELKRAGELRTELIAAEYDLAKDANAFVAELKAGLGAKPEETAKDMPLNDKVTMYFITAVGAGLLLGLFTRFWCVLGAVFLVATYLTWPTVPWLPLPPNTEGNPLFVNKNIIEALALLALAVHPTGRWLGLDALICRLFGCRTTTPTTTA